MGGDSGPGGDAGFLRQHALENQEEQDQSVFSQAASVLEQIRGIWQQTMKEKDSSQSSREDNRAALERCSKASGSN